MSKFVQKRHHYEKDIHQSLPRFINDRSLRTARRKITLYRDDDRYFVGKEVVIALQKIQIFNNYCKSCQILLIYRVMYNVYLHLGSGSEITDVNILQDGASYVCSSFELFQKLEHNY